MLRKHPVTDDNRISVSGQANYSLHSLLRSAGQISLISSAIVLALADILSSHRLEVSRPRCRRALT